ncbi:AAA domain-containing protein [Actinoplanes xinjiangensis]|uniref:AAA domain-containing protein n=1 Tax=Actinoplanes xinjiangensis TaxID=512350 RepID=UPI0034457945
MALTERTVLAVLAELAPAGTDRILDVTHGSQPLVWLADSERATRREGDRLAAVDALHREERILHRGWGFLAGRTEIDGRMRKVRVPLLSQPVRLERALTGYRVTVAGDSEVTPLITDRALAASLENAPGLGIPGWLEVIGARAWLTAAAEATGLDFDAVTEPGGRLPTDRLVLVAGAALYVVRDVFGAAPRDSLRSWAGRDLSQTALAAVYGSSPAATSTTTSAPASRPSAAFPPAAAVASDFSFAEDTDDEVVSPLPLSGAQARVVARARSAPVTVVSGPPGNGKSHTVVAAALEVVHSGGSVLIATQSPHAAEVLAALLARYPAPEPVLFGDTGSRDGLATWLAAGADEGVSSRQLRADREAVTENLHTVRTIRSEIRGILRAEQSAAALPAFEPLLAALAVDVPGAFDDTVDLPSVIRLLGTPPSVDLGVLSADVGSGPDEPTGWWARWRAGSAVKRARRLVRARPDVPLERVWEAVAAATAQRAAARLAVTGGGDLARRWEALHEAEAVLRASAGTAMRHAGRSEKRWDTDGRRAASALATALRAGRSRRRELLARMDAAPLVRALPLWIGTVADVEDLLPAAPGMFDLVVIDEASHVDQIRAAPVLARARRALVVGDPRQLRFVSFVSDAGVSEVLDRHGADDRLDVRRVSTFDLAASAAPTRWLTEHHRSVPHLIGFSARRFYGGRIATMTRTPATDATDAIDVVPVGGAEVQDGVNAAEVAAAIDAVEKLAGAGIRSIGVITPFRAQADALESALVAAFPVERIEELGLRVGTVHSFQGSEADAVVVSLGLVDGDAAGRRRFVTDPPLFNVMITRARHRLVLLTSLTAADGLIGDYITYADTPGGTLADDAAPTGWAARLATELERLDVPVRPGYAVGSWRLDLCAGPAGAAIGVLCGVHPDGPDAHLDRQSALHRAGWQLVDAFPSRWDGDPRRAALEIAALADATPAG